MSRKQKAVWIVGLIAVVATGCGSERSRANGSDTEPATVSGEMTVSAAASLTEAFTQIGKDFEAVHPGVTVRFNFDSSGTLAQQILRGAPADVFATANPDNLAGLAAENRLAGEPSDFAQNSLTIVTQPGNPAGIESLTDLSTAGIVSLCSLAAPCGTFAAQLLDRAGVNIPDRSVTRGQNVKSTLTAVTEGDAVAAIVYVTDARAAGERVVTIEVPESVNAIADYSAVSLADAPNPTTSRAFVAFLTSDAAQRTLANFGFRPPKS